MPYISDSDHDPFFKGMSFWEKVSGIVLFAILVFLSIKSLISCHFTTGS